MGPKWSWEDRNNVRCSGLPEGEAMTKGRQTSNSCAHSETWQACGLDGFVFSHEDA